MKLRPANSQMPTNLDDNAKTFLMDFVRNNTDDYEYKRDYPVSCHVISFLKS